MFWLKLIAGPVIGAVIGYFTNYIAVKMLFKPHHPVMIGSHRLPFTPGLIPKRKDELAGAIGGAVSDVLLTKQDLAEAIPSEPVKKAISENLWQSFCHLKESREPLGQALMTYIPEERYSHMKQHLEDAITEKAVDALQQLDISNLVVTEGSRAIKEKVQGTMLSMMLNDQVIQSVAGPIGNEIQSYIDNHGEEKLRPVVKSELEKLEAGSLGNLAGQIPLEKERLCRIVDGLYTSCVQGAVEKMVDQIDVAGIIEEKIQNMDVAKLEELILSVMKKELNAIVNLGALIGFVIGILNMIINML